MATAAVAGCRPPVSLLGCVAERDEALNAARQDRIIAFIKRTNSRTLSPTAAQQIRAALEVECSAGPL